MDPLEGQMANTPRLDPVSTKRQRIAELGTVKLAGMADNCPAMADIRWDSGGTRHLIPETERAGSQETVVSCPEQMSADSEEILDDAVHRCEPL